MYEYLKVSTKILKFYQKKKKIQAILRHCYIKMDDAMEQPEYTHYPCFKLALGA